MEMAMLYKKTDIFYAHCVQYKSVCVANMRESYSVVIVVAATADVP